MDPIDQMKSAYALCRQEIEILYGNLNNFLYESAEVCNAIESEIGATTSASCFESVENMQRVSKLLKYDNFMTKIGSVTNWTRKLNLLLQFNKLSNVPSLDQFTIIHSQIPLLLDHPNINIPLDNSFEKLNINTRQLKCLEESMCVENRQINLQKFCDGDQFKGIISCFPYRNSLTFYVSLLTKSEIMKFRGVDNFEPMETLPPKNSIFGIVIGTQETLVRASLINDEQLILIDFGDVMRIDENIAFYHLPDEYTQEPGFAVKCQLIGVNEQEEGEGNDILYMLDTLKNNFMKEVQLKVERQSNGVLHVRLLERCYVEKESTVARRANVFEENYVGEVYANCPDVQENQLYEVLVTHTEGISFYGQFIQNGVNSLEKYVWSSDEISKNDKLAEAPKINDLVLARFVDNMWYRAIVEECKKDSNVYKVFYVDFGNREYLPLASLAKCSVTEHMQPFLAILFVIDGLLDITVGDYVYQQKAAEILNCILDEKITVLVVQNSEKFCSIKITDVRFKNIPQILINEGYAIYNNIFS